MDVPRRYPLNRTEPHVNRAHRHNWHKEGIVDPDQLNQDHSEEVLCPKKEDSVLRASPGDGSLSTPNIVRQAATRVIWSTTNWSPPALHPVRGGGVPVPDLWVTNRIPVPTSPTGPDSHPRLPRHSYFLLGAPPVRGRQDPGPYVDDRDLCYTREIDGGPGRVDVNDSDESERAPEYVTPDSTWRRATCPSGLNRSRGEMVPGPSRPFHLPRVPQVTHL